MSRAGSTGAAETAWRELSRTSLVSLSARLGSLLVTYVVLDRWLVSVASLPEARYTRFSITLEMAASFVPTGGVSRSWAFGVALLLGFAYILVRHFRSVWIPWSHIDDGAIVRIIVAVPAIVLAWVFATYDYNLYFDRAHLLDRLALVTLAGLVIWRPVFVWPFSVLSVAIIWQFNYPIDSYSVAQHFLLVRLLVLFFAFFLLHTLVGTHRAADFVFLVVTLVAASYFSGGVGKLRLDWFTFGEISLLLPATYANGWLGFLEPETIGAMAARLAHLDWLMIGTTFVLECGAIFCLWRRRFLAAALGGWILFHCGIFALSGILFWKWIVVEGTLLALLLLHSETTAFSLFSRHHAVLSLPFIAGGVIWFHPVNLTWYNAAANYTYRFEGITARGRSVALSPRFFTPYDYQFTQSGFGYLSPHRQLGISWGAMWDRVAAEALVVAHDLADVEAVERERGQVFANDTRAEDLDAFLRTFVGNFNRRRSKATVFSLVRAPPQLWVFPATNRSLGDESIARVVVHQITSLFDGRRYQELRTRRVRVVEIPQHASS